MDHEAILKTLLQEIKEGIIVCSPEAEILLFNRAAEDIFRHNPSMRPGKSLYSLCFKPPVEQALRFLQYQHETHPQTGPPPFIQFLNGAVDAERYFRCRVSTLPGLSGAKNHFIVVFEDISAWYVPESPLFMRIEEFRAPMTNLRAAVDNLTEYPEMSPVMRSAFENVLVQESLNLTGSFEALAESCKTLMQKQNHLTELNTAVLFGYVTRYLQDKKIKVAALPGPEVMVKVDVYALLVVLDTLADRILQEKKRKDISCEVRIGEKFIYFDFIWPGEPFATGAVKSLLEKPVDSSVGRMTLDAILHAMEADIWSLQHKNARSGLRLALPIFRKSIP